MSTQLMGFTKILTCFCRTEPKPACSQLFLPESSMTERQQSLMGFKINSQVMFDTKSTGAIKTAFKTHQSDEQMSREGR